MTRLNQKDWIHITYVYVLPLNSKGLEIQFAPEAIPTWESSIICGDFNGHTPLWNPDQPHDDRGEQILDWLIEKDLEILNDGTSTHTNRQTGNPSNPDISLIGNK